VMRLPALAGRSFMRRWPRLIISIVLCAVFFILFLSSRTYAQVGSSQSSNFITPNTAENVPPNLHNWVQTLMIDTMSALSCQLSGIDPTNPNAECLGVDQKTGKIGYVENGGGLVGVLSYGIASFYNLPVGSSDYTKYLAQNFSIIKPSFAQTPNACSDEDPGICGLRPFVKIWAAARDIVYMLFVLIFIVIGLAIMFRVHIDPRTVMTIQNQIPKLITGIILVTFSFAIAGLLIDVMYIVSYLFYNVLFNVGQNFAGTNSVNLGNLNPLFLQNQNPLSAMNSNGALFTDTAGGIAGALADVVRQFIGIHGTSLIIGSDPISGLSRLLSNPLDPNVSVVDRIIDLVSFGAATGATAQAVTIIPTNFQLFGFGSDAAKLVIAPLAFTAFFTLIENVLRNWLPFFLVYIIVLIALIFVLVRLWFTLLMAYINILIDVIFAPFWLLAGLIPGGKAGFGFWLKDIISNLAAFPVAIGMLLLGQIFSNAINVFVDTPGAVFIPPLIGIPSTQTGTLGGIVAIGFIFMTPQVLTMVKKAIGAPEIDFGPIAPPFGAGIAAPLRIGRSILRIRSRRQGNKPLSEAALEELSGRP